MAPEAQGEALRGALLEARGGHAGDTASGDAAARAQELFFAAVDGEVSVECMEALAWAVVNEPRVRMALEVLAGGPHRTRRALELAREVLRAGGAAAKPAKSG